VPEVPPQHTVEKTRRFAFVEYEEPEDALAAKENLHESELGGRIIIVKYADERRSREKARAGNAQV
jgi:peptidyl-prolyl isomerase E (cyclophilin E)